MKNSLSSHLHILHIIGEYWNISFIISAGNLVLSAPCLNDSFPFEREI